MKASDNQDEKPDSKDWLFGLLVKFAAPLFVVILIMAFSLVTTLLLQKLTGRAIEPAQHYRLLWSTSLRSIAEAGLIFLFFAYFSTRWVNINKFSLNAMYRDRLIRAYLGATNPFRCPNFFTGFDEADNLPLSALRAQRPLSRDQYRLESRRRHRPRLATAPGHVLYLHSTLLREHAPRLPRFRALLPGHSYHRYRHHPRHGPSPSPAPPYPPTMATTLRPSSPSCSPSSMRGWAAGLAIPAPREPPPGWRILHGMP